MAKHNIAKMTTATTGTGTITLGSAVAGFLSFADAGVSDGEAVEYTIKDGSSTEVGQGFYTASGTTLSRDVIYSSTNSGNAISLSGSAEVMIVAPAFERAYSIFSGSSTANIANNAANTIVPIDNFWNLYSGLAHVGTGDDVNRAVIDFEGLYEIELLVEVIRDSGTLSGFVILYVEAPGGSYVFYQSFASSLLSWAWIPIRIPAQYASPGDYVEVQIKNVSGITVKAQVESLTITRIGPWE